MVSESGSVLEAVETRPGAARLREARWCGDAILSYCTSGERNVQRPA